jgi:hypothetical protein
VKAVGSQPLESFKEMLTKEEYQRCESNPQLGKTWFKLTTDIFIAFFFPGEIHNSANDFLAEVMIALHISCIYFDVCPSHIFAARDCGGLR